MHKKVCVLHIIFYIIYHSYALYKTLYVLCFLFVMGLLANPVV
jgi:hypothetical protein